MSSDRFTIAKVKHRFAKMGIPNTQAMTWQDCAVVMAEKLGVASPTSKDEIISLATKFCSQYPPQSIIAPSGLRRLNKSQKFQFYRSQEWREIRYRVLRDGGGRCVLCGASPATGAVLHVDHIEPVSKRPDLRLEYSNLQVLCEACNLGKGNRDNTRF